MKYFNSLSSYSLRHKMWQYDEKKLKLNARDGNEEIRMVNSKAHSKLNGNDTTVKR